MGTLTYDDLTGTAPSESVSVNNVPITVSFQGSAVTVTPGALYQLFGGSSIPGTLSGSTRTLNPPPDASTGLLESGTLQAATAASYNKAVGLLDKKVTSANDAAEQQQAAAAQATTIAKDQQAVDQDVSNLNGTAGELAGDVTETGSATEQTDTDLGTEESAASGGQGQYCSGQVDAASDDAAVDADGATVQADVDALTNAIGNVNSGITQLQSDLATLTSDGGSATGNPQGAISSAQSAVSSAVSQANTDISTTNGYMETGYSTADGLVSGDCSGAPSEPELRSAISA